MFMIKNAFKYLIPRYKFCYQFKTRDLYEQKLNSLYDTYSKAEDAQSRISVVNDAIKLQQEEYEQFTIDKKKQHYDGYYRDLVNLVQLYMQTNERSKCQEILDKVVNANYYEDYVDNEQGKHAFLAELNIVLSMLNLNNLRVADKYAKTALDSLKYFSDFHCPLIRSVALNQKIEQDDLELDNEIRNIDNITNQFQLIAKIAHERGQTQEAIDAIGFKAGIQDQMSQLLRQIFDNQIKVKTNLNQKELQRYFLRLLHSQAVTLKLLAKYSIDIKKYEDAQSLLDAGFNYFDYLIEIKMIDPIENNYIVHLIQQYRLNHLIQAEQSKQNEIVNKLNQIFSSAKPEDISIYSLIDYEMFKIEYLGANCEKLDAHIKELTNDVPTLLEYYELKINYFIGQNQLDDAFQTCLKQIELIKEFFDAQHYQFGGAVIKATDILIQQGKIDEAQKFFQTFIESQKDYPNQDLLPGILKFYSTAFQLYTEAIQKKPIQELIDQFERIAIPSYEFELKKHRVMIDIFYFKGEKKSAQKRIEEAIKILTHTYPNEILKKQFLVKLKE